MRYTDRMKTALVILSAVGVGLVLGGGTALLRLRMNAWDGEPGARPLDAPQAASASRGLPKIAVDAEEFDFGTMDAAEEQSHNFVISNTGVGPLQLTAGPTSCRCAVATLGTDEIPPGASTKVKLKWKAKDVIGAYRQTAVLYTNDPTRLQVTLAITGEITVAVRNDPPELIFSRVTAGQAAAGQVRLWCNLPEPRLEIRDFKLAQPDSAQYFDVTLEPLPPAEIRQERHAHSGVLVRVAVKPGLPQGPFQQTILLRTNLQSVPEVTIPIRGAVDGQIAIAGPGWDADRGLLDLGTVNSRSGAQRRLFLIAGGAQGKDVEFTLLRVAPDVLRVKLGESRQMGHSGTSQTTLTIQIPEASPPANYLGSKQGSLGLILLGTTHPQVPQIRIAVRFAVEGG